MLAKPHYVSTRKSSNFKDFEATRVRMSNSTAPPIPVLELLLLRARDDVSYFVYFSATLSAILAIISYMFLAFSNVKDVKGNRIPRGPTGLPILGSFPFLTRYPELTLDKWARKFGELYSVWLGNQLFMIISSPEIAKDLMITNGAVFSSRKEMFIKSQTVFIGRGITVTPYNATWKKHRRLATNWLHSKEVDKYTHILDREATDMVKCLYDASRNGTALVNPQPFAGRCSLNNMLTIVFGTRTHTVHDPLVKTSLRLSREFMNVSGPMSNLTDFVPILQYLPLPLRSRGRQLNKDLIFTYGGMIKNIDRRMRAGEKVPNCLSKDLLQVREAEKLDDLDLAILASAFMIGGVESTASIMQWFSALIPAYLDIQKRAQEELDSVVGRDRLPQVQDEKNLPYCHAIVKEIERCHNPFWLGTPHLASEDFTYKGQFIPRNTVLVLNTWTMHHDEKRHRDPHTFNPSRFIDDNLTSADSSNLADPYKRDHWMFGAGRRICPGMWVAEREIWLVISRMIWAFNMEAVPEHPIDLKEYDGLSGRSPVPFQIYLKPRHENVEKVLKTALSAE
ncbi:cytochrome P450 [Xylariaceae sp. FL1651]|nr:cytochrome P450 [Xylariaceae sp. FL1651]